MFVNIFDGNIIHAAIIAHESTKSFRKAAAIAGLTKRTFAELLGSYNVSIFNFPAPDLSRDVANA